MTARAASGLPESMMQLRRRQALSDFKRKHSTFTHRQALQSLPAAGDGLEDGVHQPLSAQSAWCQPHLQNRCEAGFRLMAGLTASETEACRKAFATYDKDGGFLREQCWCVGDRPQLLKAAGLCRQWHHRHPGAEGSHADTWPQSYRGGAVYPPKPGLLAVR